MDTMAVTKVRFMRNSKRVGENIKSRSLCFVLLVLFLFSGDCTLPVREQGSASEEGLHKQRQQEPLDPLGMSSRLYLNSQ